METPHDALEVDLRAIVAGAHALGVDRTALDASAQSRSTPGDAIAAVWHTVLSRRPDSATPFWVGAAVPFGHYELVDYLCGSCRTLCEGLERLDRYYRLISPKLAVTFDGRTLTVRPRVGPAQHRAVIGQYCSGVILGRFRQTSGRCSLLDAAEFAAPLTDDLIAWLDAPCRVDTDAFRFTFSREALAFAQRGADQGLGTVLQRYAEALLTRRADEADPLGPVRRAVREELQSGEVTLEQVARRLGTSERTLQRRLYDASTTFRDLLGEERMAWAQHLLGRQLTIGEVAYLLGYSEQSSFARAFRRWTGVSPRRFQQKLAAR